MEQSKPLVVLVVGHTASRPGAFAVAPLSTHEYSYNSRLAELAADKLRLDFDVAIVFRDGKLVSETYEEVAAMNPACSVELHFNSAHDPRAFGTETLCAFKWVEFATVLQTSLCVALNRSGKGDRGIKVLWSRDSRGYESVSRLGVPNAIIEPFFGSNKEDAELGLRSGEVIAEGLHIALQKAFFSVK